MKTSLLTAFRNIIKNRVNSGITIAGLSVAFACLLLIYLFVSQEFRYNNFHKKRKQIYRVNYSLGLTDGLKASMIYLEPELSKALKENVPQITRSTAYRSAESNLALPNLISSICSLLILLSGIRIKFLKIPMK